MKYDELIDYLVATAGDSISGLGEGDSKVNKLKEAQLCEAFERYVVGIDGDVGNDFFKVAEGDVLYIFNGRNYERQVDKSILGQIFKRTMSRCGVGLVYQKNCHQKIADECYSGLISSDRCRFVPDRRYVVFRNCVLDLTTGGTFEHNIRFKTDVVLDFDYIAGYHTDIWDRIIRQTIPDAGMNKAFQQFCGAFLVDRTRYKIEYILLLVGSGRNGKSLVAEAISNIFGRELVSNYSPEQLFKGSQSMYNLADIDGKLANYSDDVSNKDFSGGEFKQFTSGARFMARHIYGRPFAVTRVPLMLCCVNEIPPTTDDTNGYYRRLLPIMCPNQIADKDVDIELPSKLSSDEVKASIFTWLYEGYRSIVAASGKISISDSIRDMTTIIKEDSNSARRWIRENGLIAVKPVDRNDVRWKPMKEWMRMYNEYCKEYSECPKTVKAIGKLFKEMGFVMEKRKDTTWYCIGNSDVDTAAFVDVPVEPIPEDLPF